MYVSYIYYIINYNDLSHNTTGGTPQQEFTYCTLRSGTDRGVKQVDSCCGVPQGVRTMSTLISWRALRSDPTAVHTSRIPPRSTHRAPNSTGSQNTLVRGTCPRPIRTLQPSTSTKCTWPLGGGRGTTCSPWRRLLPYARPTRTPSPFFHPR